MYEWLVILSCIGGFFAAYGIGSNDVANAIATSVGSKTLRLWQAIIIASIFEFLGVVIMGSRVTSTIRKGMVHTEFFNDDPYTLQLGMFCVILSVVFWLLLATKYELPVSTTHTCIGGILGMAVAAGGWDAVKWNKVYLIFASWIISPTLAAITGICMFLFIKLIILKQYSCLPPQITSYMRTLFFFPLLVGITVGINASLFIFKGSSQLKLKNNPLYITIPSIFILMCISVLLSTLSLPILNCLVNRYHTKITQKYKYELDTITDIETNINNNLDDDTSISGDNTVNNEENNVVTNVVTISGIDSTPNTSDDNKIKILKKYNSIKNYLQNKILIYIKPYREDQQEYNSTVIEISKSATEYDSKSEYSFIYLQILSTCFDCFAHGSNDIANAIGPLAAIVSIYYCDCISNKTNIPFWIFIIGGLGLVTGLVLYGYKIVYAIGVKFTKITPSRGFTIEMSSSIVVIIASQLGIPISTTHCQIGSLFGIGLLEGICPKQNIDGTSTCVLHKSINWLQLIKILFGWIITLFISASTSAGLFSLLYYSHSYHYQPSIPNNSSI